MKKSDKIKGVFEIDMKNNLVNYIITSTHTIQKNRIELMENFIENANYNIEVEDRLTKQQREKIWCILDEFAYCFGGSKEEWREQLETKFCEEKDLEYFSISELKRDGASKQIAREFIQWLTELAIMEGVGFREYMEHWTEWVPDIARIIIACLKAKRCCVTGKPEADIHHVESVGASGYNSSFIDDLLVLPLCREMHNKIHNMGDKSFIELEHLVPVPVKLAKGIWTDEEIKKEIEFHINPKTNSDYQGAGYEVK